MGSYLQINRRETNSKAISQILIDVIRELDSQIKESQKTTKEQKEWFVAESYDEKYIGYGDWIIKKKGIALLACRLKNMMEDRKTLERIGMEHHKYFTQTSHTILVC